MNLREFINSGAVRGRVRHKEFSFNVKYSEPGCGHYFTLSDLPTSNLIYFSQFLDAWERRFTFCVISPYDGHHVILEKRGYSRDEHGNFRIGIIVESMSQRAERRMRDKKMLPRGGRTKQKVTPQAKAKVAEAIAKRNGNEEVKQRVRKGRPPKAPGDKKPTLIKAAGDTSLRIRRTRAQILEDAKRKDAAE